MQIKLGDLVRPLPSYLDDFTRPLYLPAGIVIEVVYDDNGGALEPETAFSVQWPSSDPPSEWNDWELELVSEAR